MAIIFDKNKPIYQQLVDHLRNQIANGELAPGAKVPSVRDMALEYQVNPNTMQKALAKLEEAGYMYTERTSGRYVTEDLSVINSLQATLLQIITVEYVQDMSDTGMATKDIPVYVQCYINAKKGENND